MVDLPPARTPAGNFSSQKLVVRPNNEVCADLCGSPLQGHLACKSISLGEYRNAHSIKCCLVNASFRRNRPFLPPCLALFWGLRPSPNWAVELAAAEGPSRTLRRRHLKSLNQITSAGAAGARQLLAGEDSRRRLAAATTWPPLSPSHEQCP